MSDVEIGLIQPGEWERYREFRLKTSREDPYAWGLTTEEEASFPNEWWMDQLEKAEGQGGLWLYFAIINGQIVGMIGALQKNNRSTLKLQS